MVMKNAKNRPPKFRENSHIGNVESDSRILGDAATASPEHGSYQIAVDGKNSDEGDSDTSGSSSNNSIPGKIVSQLIGETEKQLAYHEQQAELLRSRLQELKEIPINDTE
ncbi:hypothetical protein [Fortiea contorta]|uniref:hypothetical protein n=1 Tax=Fortiea contorta TaxID=1892405 RepID=UPI00035DC852|nr:hypothetical protein [Fortiea contorta]